MSATINIHNIRAVEAKEFQRVEWLEFECEDGTTVSVFVPLSAAQAMADAFNANTAGDT